jgi:hypothetical protein
MIEAIVKGKTSINAYEDELTSTVFGHLFLLPDEILWKIIGKEALQKSEVGKYEFWPKWNPEGTDNTKYVEADVFISTTNFDIIVEVKRDSNGHTVSQWKNEIISYQNEYGKNKTVYLLAIGGVKNELQKEEEGITILQLSWNSLLTNAQQALKSSDDSNNICSKILERLLVGMSIFGYYEHRWFNVWEQSYKLSNYDLAVKQLNPPKTDFLLQKTDLMLQYKISDKYLSLLA